MLRSMTGFGKSVKELSKKQITVEIRSVNSKIFDFNIRVPSVYREKESEIRLYTAGKLERGKIDIYITIENTDAHQTCSINKELASFYIQELRTLSNEHSLDEKEILPAIIRLPDIIKSAPEQPDETEWELLMHALEEAIEKIDKCRLNEGKILEKDISERIINIETLLNGVEKFEQTRVDDIKVRILKNLKTLAENTDYDRNRFEQELFYYIEKLDITEEKIRLSKHCKYFLQTTKENDCNGKKLGFISQEIGREINTLGSKANNVDIQKIVVNMKDELEKIKEQLLNIL